MVGWRYKVPLSKHFGGKGEKVMAAMKRQYGAEKGERVFYAIESKRKKSKKLARKIYR